MIASDHACSSHWLKRCIEEHRRIEGRQDRFGHLEQAALVDELTFKGGGLRPEAPRRVGGRECLGREAGIDDEEAKVVVGELIEPQLGQHEDAQDLVLEDHVIDLPPPPEISCAIAIISLEGGQRRFVFDNVTLDIL